MKDTIELTNSSNLRDPDLGPESVTFSVRQHTISATVAGVEISFTTEELEVLVKASKSLRPKRVESNQRMVTYRRDS